MTAHKETGGPAFPVPTGCGAEAGMVLRDYFAAKAMQGMLACPEQLQSDEHMFARDAYQIADAMLKERNKR